MITSARTGVVAVTVAVRGVSVDERDLAEEVTRAELVDDLRPSWLTSASPSSRTKNSRPECALARQLLALGEVDLVGDLRDLLSSRTEQFAKSGTRLSSSTFWLRGHRVSLSVS